jgi:hypothetical protein
MSDLPPLAPGFVRIGVQIRENGPRTPGELAQATGLPPDDIGHIVVEGEEAFVDVRSEQSRQGREHLQRIGNTRLAERHWQWLRINIGRNHGLSMGQLRRIMQNADALPVGKISISNTHTMIGLQDHKMAHVVECLAHAKINGFNAKPVALPLGEGPGSAAFTGSANRT